MAGNKSTAYLCSDFGMLLPIIDESTWSRGVRAILYLIALLYTFFGISIAADVFMCAIERITSQTRTVKVRNSELDPDTEVSVEGDQIISASGYQLREIRVWNPTVANLTLMALGSSAPEILLSIIEIAGRDFEAGPLGPSTIVGSAAFNLLVITAVCISAIPTGETRQISELLVFAVTSFFCIFAYIWLLIILKVTSPMVVEIWEALITLLFFLVLIVLAYVADKKFCLRWFKFKPRKKRLNNVEPEDPYELKANQKTEPHADGEAKHVDFTMGNDIDVATPSTIGLNGTNQETRPATGKSIQIVRTPSAKVRPPTARNEGMTWLNIERLVAQRYPSVNAETLAKLTARRINISQPHSRMYYRIAATRWMASAGKEYKDPLENDLELRPGTADTLRPISGASGRASLLALDPAKMSIIEFAANKYAASETDHHIRIKVVRTGRTSKRVLFKYETLDGTARAGRDYVAQSETLVFNPSETEKIISIEIIQREGRDPEEMFYIKLALEDYADGRTMVGPNNIAIITIQDSDRETKITYIQNAMAVKENVGVVHIPVQRRGNTRNKASVHWNTVNGTAHEGSDFIGGQGLLEFDVGEIEKHIAIPIIDDKDFEKHESFEVVLNTPSEGVSLSSKKKRIIITILNDDETTLLLTQSDKLVPKQLESLQPGSQTWRTQFVHAANVNGGDIEQANSFDYLIHMLTFGWKLLFACVPPPCILGGWPCFFIALILIGLLVAVVADLAGILGCLIDLRPSVTAITFVALGTSLPDLFASMLAAKNEDTADNSIGNITGSNGVNVFMGLGVGWLMAAIYWGNQGKEFRVAAGGLSFSVTIYCVCAVLCLLLLVLRRKLSVLGGAELGGAKVTKYLCSVFLVALWVFYIVLSSFQAYDLIPGF